MVTAPVIALHLAVTARHSFCSRPARSVLPLSPRFSRAICNVIVVTSDSSPSRAYSAWVICNFSHPFCTALTCIVRSENSDSHLRPKSAFSAAKTLCGAPIFGTQKHECIPSTFSRSVLSTQPYPYTMHRSLPLSCSLRPSNCRDMFLLPHSSLKIQPLLQSSLKSNLCFNPCSNPTFAGRYRLPSLIPSSSSSAPPTPGERVTSEAAEKTPPHNDP